MKDPREVIIRPVITEHSYDMMNKNTYTFEVAKDSNKVEIRSRSAFVCSRVAPAPGRRPWLR